MDWILLTSKWWLGLFFLGLVFLPLTRKIFAAFIFDQAYPIAKTLALLLLSYLLLVLGVIKVLPFTQAGILLLVILAFSLNYFFLQPQLKKKLPLKIIIFEEVLFVFSLFLWTFIRGQEGSIRGLEKFMDFGFINSILRADYFPPLDMWYAKLPINYYYFGHLSGATLIKLINIPPAVGYNLILATIFALSVTQVFSLIVNIIFIYGGQNKVVSFIARAKLIFFGLLGAFLVNLGGNLHTIYLFTKGYNTDNPQPFWQILSSWNPTSYWYPNATRFIPFTIHEFPSYSYVVADLHGHVFDIPFILVTLAIIFQFFVQLTNKKKFLSKTDLVLPCILGFLAAVHYMTNAFDGPIYLLLALIIFFAVFGLSRTFIINLLILFGSFWLFSLPFSVNFSPFVSGIGVNCGASYLETIFKITNLGKIGPFLFETGNCQISPVWMLFALWGFYWICFLGFFLLQVFFTKKQKGNSSKSINYYLLFLFGFGIFLTLIPEFFYIKDIYPQHFRANTMFKLGYQAFIMLMIASTVFIFQLKNSLNFVFKLVALIILVVCLTLVSIYPFFSIPSYYGLLTRPVQLDGSDWLKNQFPEDKEIIDYLNNNIRGQPVILEAQGDSYTDYERISAYTGLPTVAGWWVHEWLWRGSADVVGNRIPDIITIYESDDIEKTKALLKKYQIQYLVISQMEKEKYPKLIQSKFDQIGEKIFTSSNNLGALYKVNY